MRLRTLLAAFALAGPLPSGAADPDPQLHLFTLPGCSACAKAKAYLAERRIPYHEHDLATPEGGKAAEAMDVPAMAPVFAYGNRVLRGFTPEKLAHFLAWN